jgi:hypothetical protein
VIAKRPLPDRDAALAYAREMVPQAKWGSIVVESGGTDQGGGGLLLQACADCWIITYDPAPSAAETLEERIWVDKATGVVVKMMLED